MLGVSKDADAKEIRRAYRRLAMLHHPDRSKEPGAAERFKEISEAYAVLSGKERPTGAGIRMRDAPPPAMEPDPWGLAVIKIWQRIVVEKRNSSYR